MRLLLDENISHRLVGMLAGIFPGSRHVRDVGLARADDLAIWQYARANGFAIVTLDSDFYDFGLLRGWPPKVVWLRTLNLATSTIHAALVAQASAITAFLADADNACMMVFGARE